MHEYYMGIALKEAKKSLKKDDVPVGAIIIKDNKIIAKAHNNKENKGIATYHAEVIAIEKACKKMNNWRLEGCTMYVTLEPCLMCAGAILQARIDKLVYSTENKKFGSVTSINDVLNNKKNNHKVDVVSGIMKKESQKILKDFFKDKRD
jgi:tRNA(adenine34) deaminase